MLQIAFVLHDALGKYCKNIGVTLASVFENTKEKITVHIVHDETLTVDNKKNLVLLCKEYRQDIVFHEIRVEASFYHERFTVGTFMKLYIPYTLPSDVDKVLYLDSDICVNLDIAELWNVGLQDKSLGVVKNWRSCGNELWICEKIGIEDDFYFNAGVLLMDIGKIRATHDLVNEAVDFFTKYPCANLADQDALNYIFYRDTLFLDEKYNFLAQGVESEIVEGKIYHFAGAKKPWKGYWGAYSKMYLHYLAKTPWFNAILLTDLYKRAGEKIAWLENFYRHANGRKIILFGAGEVGEKLADRLILDKDRDYYVDNNPSKWNKKLNGFNIFEPEKLWAEKAEDVIIVISLLAYSEIKNCLIKKGYKENKNFFDGRVLLEMEGGGDYFY